MSIMKPVPRPKGSVPVDFLRPKFRVAHTKHDVISILMNEYTYLNMYIINPLPFIWVISGHFIVLASHYYFKRCLCIERYI